MACGDQPENERGLSWSFNLAAVSTPAGGIAGDGGAALDESSNPARGPAPGGAAVGRGSVSSRFGVTVARGNCRADARPCAAHFTFPINTLAPG